MYETRGDDVFEFVHDDEGIHYHQTKKFGTLGDGSQIRKVLKPSRCLPSFTYT
jgi:hypothetical protein